MSEIEQNEILDNLRDIDSNSTLLDMLLEFEHVFDKQGLYAYKNWKLGEIVEGPNLSRYWLHVKLMYPYKKMPDPIGALRLTQLGCEIEFKKGSLLVPKSPDPDSELTNGEKREVKKHPIWLIDIWMPRRLVDEFSDDKIKMSDGDIDVNELNQAYDDGLDDETRIENQGGIQ
jgi:hypothetical protein